MTEIITQNTELAPMTRREAETATQEFIASGNRLRVQLLDLFERKAYKALGYSSFEEYTKERLSMNYDASYLSRLLTWAKTERNLIQCEKFSDSKTFTLTRDVAEQLAKLPTPELQRKVYSELEAMERSGSGVPQQYFTNFKNRVKQLLAKPVPKAEPPADNFTEQNYPAPPDAREALDAEPVGDTRPTKPPVSSYAEKFDDGDFPDDTPAPVVQVPAVLKSDYIPDWLLWENTLQTILAAVKAKSIEIIPEHMRIDTMAINNEITAWIEEAV